MERLNKTFISVSLAGILLCVLFLAGVALASPSDPPSAADYSSASNYDTCYYRRSSTNYTPSCKAVQITTSNTNFVLSHARDTAGNKITHWHYQKNYGSDFGGTHGTVTTTEGNAFWDWYYDDFSTITRTGSPTNTTNCTCYAYDEYKSASTQANYWVNSNSDSAKYKDEVYEISPSSTDNSDFDTIAGDRCHHTDHVWTIVTSNPDCPAKKIRWKNNCSAIYTWDMGATSSNWTNDSPKDSSGGKYTSSYAVYNKTDR
jgi:hypothetical protein